jgi:hypothetical protein
MPGTITIGFAGRQPRPEKRPMSSIHVTVRLNRDAWTRYSREAHTRGFALGTHLRHRLEEQDRLVAELALRAITEQDSEAREQPSKEPSPGEPGTLVEVLLLLRSLAGPQKSAMVQKEVERRGLASWK